MILHLDADAFFASVEQAQNPRLKGRAVVVGAERGIAAAFSYEAKALGITRAMPIYQVRRQFPQAIIVSGDYDSYSIYSKRIFDIVRRYSDTVDEYSLDECFARLPSPCSGSGGQASLEPCAKAGFACLPPLRESTQDSPLRAPEGSPVCPAKDYYYKIVQAIQADVARELDIGVSVGVSLTKTLAKAGSKFNKPKGIVIIDKDSIPDYLSRIDVEAIWGIGRQTYKKLKAYGINTAYDFYAKPEGWVTDLLHKPFHDTWRELHGQVVHELYEGQREAQKSIQKTRTFKPPSSERAYVFAELSKNIENACMKARRYRLATKRISIFLKTQDFRYHTADFVLDQPTNIPEDIIGRADALFDKIYSKKLLYRATGVTLADLQAPSEHQADIFGNHLHAEKLERLHFTTDMIAERYGKHAVFIGASMPALSILQADTGRKSLANDPRHLMPKAFNIPLLGSVS